MAKVKAVIFDLDGVLRDSLQVIWPATQQALAAHGVNATLDEVRPHIHYHGDVHKKFANHVSWEEFDKTFYEKAAKLRSRHALYEAADKLLQDLHSQGYKLGMATSATTAKQFLAKHGVAELFTAIITPHDTDERKPSPVPVQLALEGLACRPEEAVMVGDLPADILSAKAAGVTTTIGITHGFGTRQMLEAAGADHVIDKLEELPKLLDTINYES